MQKTTDLGPAAGTLPPVHHTAARVAEKQARERARRMALNRSPAETVDLEAATETWTFGIQVRAREGRVGGTVFRTLPSGRVVLLCAGCEKRLEGHGRPCACGGAS